MSTEHEQDAATLFKELGNDPTLDLAMQKDPRDLSIDDMAPLVAFLRAERATFNVRREGG